jgi:TadE-like protein
MSRHTNSSRRPQGRETRLMYGPSSSDRGLEPSVAKHDHTGAWRRREDRERGQAMVEFALILFPLLLLVAGIIQFGIGLNFWLDENRIANQGARHAVVNHWPGCPRLPTGTACNVTTWDCTGNPPAGIQLDRYLHCQAISRGLRNKVAVTICYPDDGDPDPSTDPGRGGTPVRVRLSAPFRLVPFVSASITLRGEATMRLEQDATHLSGVGPCPLPPP